MSETFRGVSPLDWQSLVGEALRRRKEEGLTQKEHAALANVSIPTIAAFDRGETTLTLAKAFDILRVVGLLSEPGEAGAQAAFVREAGVDRRPAGGLAGPLSPWLVSFRLLAGGGFEVREPDGVRRNSWKSSNPAFRVAGFPLHTPAP